MRTSLGGWLAAALLAVFSLLTLPAHAQAPQAVVTVTDDGETYTLSNGVVTAVVSKRSADLLSLSYKGVETLTPDSGGHSGAYWSHDVTGGVQLVPRISIDPASNGGERAEVSIKGISGGRKMGHGPGTPVDGDIALDIDIRWSLGRDDRGVYTYTAFEHRPEYPGGTMSEARIAVELAKFFDNIHVDDARSGKFPVLNEGIDKYVYTALQADERAYGWTSSTRNIGWFLLNPSAEYLSGGPTKAEFLAHGRPTVLNYWKSSHYYGANVTVSEGETWTKVIGPFMFYVNEGSTHRGMIADARAQLAREEQKWPYDWVKAVGYAAPGERSEVRGQLALVDPLMPDAGGGYSGVLTVGLSKAPYTVPSGESTRTIEWQNDGKFYQFWSRNTDPGGRFAIPDVAPGKYTLFAFAEGVLGEYVKSDIDVGEAGGVLDLGRLQWTPVRFGSQLWDVGTADRSGREFLYGDRYFEPGVQLRFPETLPKGVIFRPGRSDPGSDWFFAHAPTPRPGAEYEIRAFSGVLGDGAETPYSIVFDMKRKPVRGTATLRIALTTNSASSLNVAVNGTDVGAVPLAPSDASLARHQMYGRWFETWLSFDAGLLREGENTLTLTIPAGPLNNALVYDYLRLELSESAAAPPAPPRFLPRLRLGAAEPKPVTTTYEIRTALDDVRFGLPALAGGGRQFAVLADPSGRQTIFAATPGQPARRLIDPDVFGAGALAEWRPSPDGKLIAYAVADGAGEDAWRRIRVWDVLAGAQLEDEILWVKHSSIAWAADNSGFYYSRYRDPSPDPEVQRFNTAQEVFFHALGDDRLDDRRVYASDRGGMVHFAETTDDGRWVVVNASVEGNGRSEVVLIDRTRKHPGPFKAIRTMSDSWQLAGAQGDRLFFVTSAGARNRRLVSLETSDFSLPIVEVVSEADQRLEAARIDGDVVHLSYAGAAGPTVKTMRLPAPR